MTLSFRKTHQLGRDEARLCVVGNLTIDIILRGIVAMPEWGQEVICEERTESVAGQAGAMAFAASAMGIATDLVSVVGNDDAGDRIRDELKATGINVDSVSVATDGTTPMTIALVRPDGERAFVSDLGTFPGINVVAAAISWVSDHSPAVVALVGTSNLRPADTDRAVDLFREAHRAGAITIFDPGWDPLGWSTEVREGILAILAETDLFLPNQDEVHALTGQTQLERQLYELADICSGVTVVKAGALGSYVADGATVFNVPAVVTTVDNAVGAGDVYDAGVIAGYLRGLDLFGSLAFASAAASIYISRRDHRFPNYAECSELARGIGAAQINPRSD